MEQYRFHLEKYHTGCKKQCPKCGCKACFTHYVDSKREIHFLTMSAGVTTNKVVAITLRQETIFKNIRKFSKP